MSSYKLELQISYLILHTVLVGSPCHEFWHNLIQQTYQYSMVQLHWHELHEVRYMQRTIHIIERTSLRIDLERERDRDYLMG